MSRSAIAVQPATLPGVSGSCKLSSHWTPDRVFNPFYNGGTALYNSAHHVVFCLYAGSVSVIDPESSTFLARIGGGDSELRGENYSDSILSFAVSTDGSIVVAACRSLLIRVWALNWNRRRDDSQDKTDEAAVRQRMSPAPFHDNLLGLNIIPVMLTRSWKVSGWFMNFLLFFMKYHSLRALPQ